MRFSNLLTSLASLLPLLVGPLLETQASGLGLPELHDAIAALDRSRAEMLILEGADLEERDAYGRTPLFMASRAGDEELVRQLLERGADIDAANLGGLTPLHVAVARGHTEIARLLLVNCAEVEPRDLHRRTPLHLAATRGRTDASALLIDAGSNVQARLRSGQGPFQLAISYRHPRTIDFLRSQLPALPEPEEELEASADGSADPEARATDSEASAPEPEAPAPVASRPPARERRPTRPLGTEGTTRFLQENLSELGYDAGPADGRRTQRLLAAAEAYQRDVGIVRSSELGSVTRCLVDRMSVEIGRRERADPSASARDLTERFDD